MISGTVPRAFGLVRREWAHPGPLLHERRAHGCLGGAVRTPRHTGPSPSDRSAVRRGRMTRLTSRPNRRTAPRLPTTTHPQTSIAKLDRRSLSVDENLNPPERFPNNAVHFLLAQVPQALDRSSQSHWPSGMNHPLLVWLAPPQFPTLANSMSAGGSWWPTLGVALGFHTSWVF